MCEKGLPLLEMHGRSVRRPKMASRANISAVVKEAFLQIHQGYSADEVIICERLNKAFIATCAKRLPFLSEQELNWHLITLRKQGKLGRVATKRDRTNHDDYFHASEIAARLLYDKHGVSIDRAFCSPEYRDEFDRIANSVAPDVSDYLLRKAALKLRKNRQLKPELIPRIASWSKTILDFPADNIIQNPGLVPRKPGIYILRDASGYLYIGESKDLYLRVRKHLDHSDRKSLARYFWKKGLKHITVELHAFDADSDARLKSCRRAYESSLIQSRHPRLNLQP